MKHINIKTIIGTTMLTLFLVACSDILEEQPRSILAPGFFKTEQGVNGGLTSLYAHLRFMYGNAYYYNSGVTGTDEATWAQSADANFKVMDVSGQGNITPTVDGGIGTLWTNAFPAINTASGIIENATAVGLKASLIAEARFFRAFDYFHAGTNIWRGAIGYGRRGTEVQHISVQDIDTQYRTRGLYQSHIPGPADSRKRFAGCRAFNRHCNQNGCTPVFGKSLPDLCMVAAKPKQHSYLSGM